MESDPNMNAPAPAATGSGREGEVEIYGSVKIAAGESYVKPDALAKWSAVVKMLRALPGSYVIPLRPGTKLPAATKGESWKIGANEPNSGTRDPAKVKAWLTADAAVNLGICPGENAVVIDLDVKKADGVGAWRALEAIFGEAPTLTVSTPSGGVHLYYRLNGGPAGNMHSLPDGIDVRGAAGYVALPGSALASGVYAVVNQATVAEAPDWVREKLKPLPKRAPDWEKPIGELDTPERVSRAREFLKHRKPAIEGERGNDWTYATFAMLRSLGVSLEKSLEIATQEGVWNERCEPPWSYDELAVVAENAWQYATGRPGDWGGVMDSYKPEVAAMTQDESAADEIAAMTFGELDKRDAKPVEYLLRGFVRKSVVNFLSGPGGVHKSRLALQIGRCIDAGASAIGRATQRARFVYVSAEDDADEVTRRSQAIARKLKLPAESEGVYLDRYGRNNVLAIVSEGGGVEFAPFYAALRDWLKAISGHKFVVLDSCYDFVQWRGAAKIDEPAVRAFIRAVLDPLGTETDSTLLVLWHPSRTGIAAGDMAGWSVAWENAPRNKLTLGESKVVEDAYELRVGKANAAKKGDSVTLHWADGALLPAPELDASVQTEKVRAACLALAEECALSGGPIQKQRKLAAWQLERLQKAAGRTVDEREFREHVTKAVFDKVLVFVPGSQHRMAGFYPADEADALARDAKRGRGESKVVHLAERRRNAASADIDPLS